MLDALTIPRPRRRSTLGAAIAAVGALVLATSPALAVWLTSGGGGGDGHRSLSAAAFAEETGIEVVRVAVVGGGGIVDVRYRVKDGERAAAIQAGDHGLTVVDEETGRVLASGYHGKHSGGVLHGGAHGQKNPTLPVGAVYYVLLSNTGGALQPGETASLLVGHLLLEHIPVQ